MVWSGKCLPRKCQDPSLGSQHPQKLGAVAYTCDSRGGWVGTGRNLEWLIEHSRLVRDPISTRKIKSNRKTPDIDFWPSHHMHLHWQLHCHAARHACTHMNVCATPHAHAQTHMQIIRRKRISRNLTHSNQIWILSHCESHWLNRKTLKPFRIAGTVNCTKSNDENILQALSTWFIQRLKE